MLKVAGGIGGGGNGSGTVTQVSTGTGLTGGPITTSGTIRIANTAVTAASYGSANTVATFTVNQQGQLTAASNATISINVGAVAGAVPNTVNVIAGVGMSGGGALTGNVTIDLGNTSVVANTYGSSTEVAQFTVDAQGRITSATNVAISTGGSGTVTNVATGTGLTGGPITTTGTISLDNTAVTAGIYGDGSNVSQVTIDAQGRITNAVNVAISISTANVSGLGTMATQDANAVAITGGTFANANITSVVATFPNSYLSNSAVTIGNVSVSLGSTETTFGNLVLQNANITSVASTFPNSYLSNSTTTLGNATLTLGSTTTSVGNLTLTNVTVSSGSVTANVTSNNVNFTGTTTANATFATSSLPLVPEGYITVQIGGVDKKIPYYGV